MASIQKVQNKTGKRAYRVFIRQPGLRPITKTFSTKKCAQDYARRVEGDAETAEALGGESAAIMQTMTLADLIDKFMLHYTGRGHGTVSQVNWWRDNFGDTKLAKIDRSCIRKGLRMLGEGDALRGHGRKKGGKTVSVGRKRSQATLVRYKAALASVFKWGMLELDLPKNPCREVPMKSVDNQRTRYLSEDERKALLKACKASDWKQMYLIFILAITTGARRGELLSLTWADIDLRARRAYVRTSKNGEPRVLPLTTDVVVELMKFRGKQDALVFPSERKPSQPMDFTKHWKTAMVDAEITNYRWHDNRHSAASHLAMNGASLLEIAEVLGHKQLQVTKRYAHLCIDHKQTLIDRVMAGVLDHG